VVSLSECAQSAIPLVTISTPYRLFAAVKRNSLVAKSKASSDGFTVRRMNPALRMAVSASVHRSRISLHAPVRKHPLQEALHLRWSVVKGSNHACTGKVDQVVPIRICESTWKSAFCKLADSKTYDH
jgi:hypothetical protein